MRRWINALNTPHNQPERPAKCGAFGCKHNKESKMEIDYIYIDENGLTVTRLKPQKTVEEYRAHTGGLFDDDLIDSIDDLTGE